MTGRCPQRARPPEAYVHGINGPAAVVPGRVAAWLNARGGLNELRMRIRGEDPEVDAVLVALSVAGTAWLTSACGTGDASAPEVPPQSTWLTTTEAADRLGLTDRAIRLACSTGRLPAERAGGRWRISREDVEHYRAARQAA